MLIMIMTTMTMITMMTMTTKMIIQGDQVGFVLLTTSSDLSPEAPLAVAITILPFNMMRIIIWYYWEGIKNIIIIALIMIFAVFCS